MKKILSVVFFSLFLGTLITGCASVRVTRTNPGEVLDLSGRWNDTDARLVANTMSTDLMKGAWLIRFRQTCTKSEVDSHVQKPVVIVGDILNKSHEHIEADTFVKDIEKELIERGEMRIVANNIFREKLREERRGQVGYVAPETQRKFGRELGADYMIFGTINTIVDTEGKNRVTFYQVSLELVNLETNEKEWMGDKKIKKYTGTKIKSKYKGILPVS